MNYDVADPKKDKWSFYIRFKISEPLGIESDEIKFLGKFTIRSDNGLPLKESTVLKLENSEHLIYRKIVSFAKKVEQSLILSFADMGIGVTYAENLASERPAELIKKGLVDSFISSQIEYDSQYCYSPLIECGDKYGLQIFLAKVDFWNSEGEKSSEPIDIKKLGVTFESHYDKLNKINVFDDVFKKITTATTIFATLSFDDSIINKIILAMTVIEVLSEKIMRTNEEIDILNTLTKNLNDMDIDDGMKKSLELGLSSIKYQSISKSCKIVVKNLLGKKDANLFYNLYNYRSQLVHSGEIKQEEEIYKIYTDSYMLAKKLLLAYINNVSSDPKYVDQYIYDDLIID